MQQFENDPVWKILVNYFTTIKKVKIYPIVLIRRSTIRNFRNLEKFSTGINWNDGNLQSFVKIFGSQRKGLSEFSRYEPEILLINYILKKGYTRITPKSKDLRSKMIHRRYMDSKDLVPGWTDRDLSTFNKVVRNKALSFKEKDRKRRKGLPERDPVKRAVAWKHTVRNVRYLENTYLKFLLRKFKIKTRNFDYSFARSKVTTKHFTMPCPKQLDIHMLAQKEYYMKENKSSMLEYTNKPDIVYGKLCREGKEVNATLRSAGPLISISERWKRIETLQNYTTSKEEDV
jgi:hypothetical protein